MSKKTNSNFFKYGIATAVAAAVAFGIMCWRGIFAATNPTGVISAISDGFFAAGLLYTGFGLMCCIINEGVLDIIGFGFRSLLCLFTPRRIERDEGGYYEYKIRKKEERAKKALPSHLIWIGVAFMLISGMFLFIYYKI